MKHNITLTVTILALIVTSILFYDNSFFVFIIIGIIAAYFLTLVFGSGLIQLNYFVKSINHGNQKGIAITFDDGPDANFTPKILDLLAAANVKASFFIIGHKVESQKELMLRIFNEGHTIGNHSFSHTKSLTTSSSKKLIEDFSSCSTAIENIIGKSPLFFRAPFGVTNPRYNKALKPLQLTSIGWSLRSLDTKTEDASYLSKKVINKIKDGDILLFHDTHKVTLEALPIVLAHCKNNGINIVSLPEFINKKSYA